MALPKFLHRLVLLVFLSGIRFGDSKELRICHGTNSGFSVSVSGRVEHLSSRYTNCAIVHGNLEIVGLKDSKSDLSFLKDIEIVTGYVLIALNEVPVIPLENLKIIRGQKLYGPDKHALLVVINSNVNQAEPGVRELGLKSLTEIQRGNVSISRNDKLCFVDTINWEDIMNKAARRSNGWRATMNNTASECPSCHQSCNGHCWGSGPDKCQKLTSTICHNICGDSRCNGPGPDQCCHSQCASGCSGPTARDCTICLNVKDDDACQSDCPSKTIYDPERRMYVSNPAFKYRLGWDCVESCPRTMLIEDDACVDSCGKGMHVVGSRECVPCRENECNSGCYGIENVDGPWSNSMTIDSTNVRYFEGCEIIRGNVIFSAYAFSGDRHSNVPPMTAAQVQRAFSSVKVITGYLKILGWDKSLHDFSVFSNLTTIEGNTLFREVVSLIIQDSITQAGPFKLNQVRSLGFRSLKSISFGNIYIGYMKNLCYYNSIDWQKIIKSPVPHRSFNKGVLLRGNAADCTNRSCHPLCDDSGCWGPDVRDCLACRKFSQDGICVASCDPDLGLYLEDNKCMPCDEQCQDTCRGPGPRSCITCKHYRDNGVCVRECPLDKFGDPTTKECLPCHETCNGQIRPSSFRGPICTGPESTFSSNGCSYCPTVLADRNLRSLQCLPVSETTCPEGYYENDGFFGIMKACMPCAIGCHSCTGPNELDCLQRQPNSANLAVYHGSRAKKLRTSTKN